MNIRTKTPTISGNVVFNFAGQASTLMVAIICMPLLLRFLGQDRIGVLSIIWVVIGYLTILDFGIGLAVTQMASAARSKEEGSTEIPRIFWNGFYIQLAFGMVGAAALILSTPFLVTDVLRIPGYLQSEAKISLFLAGLAFPAVLVSSSINGLIQAVRRFDLLILVQIPAGIAQFAFPILLLLFWKSLTVAVLAIVLTRFVSALILFILATHLVPELKRKWTISLPFMWRLLNFGGWITISTIISPLIVFSDRFFLGHLLSISAVAFYSVPSDAVIRFLFVPRSLMSVLFTVFSGFEVQKDNARIAELLSRSLKYIASLMGLAVTLVIINAHDILLHWLGAEFAFQATSALQILLLGIFACSLSLIPVTFLQAMGRADITAKIHLIEFPLFVSLSFFLISKYGITGAAIAWSARLVIESGILFTIMINVAKVPIRSLLNAGFIKILLMIAGILILGKTASLVAETIPAKAMVGFVVALGSGAFTWISIFSETDRRMFRGLFFKKKSRSTE